MRCACCWEGTITNIIHWIKQFCKENIKLLSQNEKNWGPERLHGFPGTERLGWEWNWLPWFTQVWSQEAGLWARRELRPLGRLCSDGPPMASALLGTCWGPSKLFFLWKMFSFLQEGLAGTHHLDCDCSLPKSVLLRKVPFLLFLNISHPSCYNISHSFPMPRVFLPQNQHNQQSVGETGDGDADQVHRGEQGRTGEWGLENLPLFIQHQADAPCRGEQLFQVVSWGASLPLSKLFMRSGVSDCAWGTRSLSYQEVKAHNLK